VKSRCEKSPGRGVLDFPGFFEGYKSTIVCYDIVLYPTSFDIDTLLLRLYKTWTSPPYTARHDRSRTANLINEDCNIMPRVYPPIDGKTSQPSNQLPPSLIETVAGFTAGVVSTLVVHPFDVVKTRLQGRPQRQCCSNWGMHSLILVQSTKPRNHKLATPFV